VGELHLRPGWIAAPDDRAALSIYRRSYDAAGFEEDARAGAFRWCSRRARPLPPNAPDLAGYPTPRSCSPRRSGAVLWWDATPWVEAPASTEHARDAALKALEFEAVKLFVTPDPRCRRRVHLRVRRFVSPRAGW